MLLCESEQKWTLIWGAYIYTLNSKVVIIQKPVNWFAKQKAVNYFRKKAPWQILDWVLNTPLTLASSWWKCYFRYTYLYSAYLPPFMRSNIDLRSLLLNIEAKFVNAFSFSIFWQRVIPANIYLFKINNRNTRKRCEMFSKLTRKTPERRLKNLK